MIRCLLIWLVLLPACVFSQSIIRSSINSMSASYENANLVVRASLGQPAVVGTDSDGQYVIRQGFQQPINNPALSIHSPEDHEWEIYPNPTEGLLNLEFDGKLRLEVYSLDGRLLEKHELASMTTGLELGHLPASTYLLKLENDARSEVHRLSVR